MAIMMKMERAMERDGDGDGDLRIRDKLWGVEPDKKMVW